MTEINIVEHADGELRVSSLIIAGRTDNQHKNVVGLVRANQGDLEDLGPLAFETRMGGALPQGGFARATEYALLNEQQATYLITLMRNSLVVRAFKLELVKQFYAMRQALATTPALTEDEIVHRALAITAARVEAAEQQVRELTPRAESWDQLADASGTYTVTDAGKLLASAGCQTGPRMLFQQLRELGWIFKRSGIWTGKQDKINAGYLAEFAGSHFHPRTGERVLDAPTVRVTVAGLGKLREFFGGAVPLLEVAP